LALLPLPVYVTTGHHDFLERALIDVGKHPRVQVCNWFSKEGHPALEWFDVPPESEKALDSRPDPVHPLVYHLYGVEKDPLSLVISEDDYMEFLVRVSEDRNAIPLGLQRALAQSAILLLGYRLRCWDFRVLCRGIVKKSIEDSKLEKPNLAIQLSPPVLRWEAGTEMPDYSGEAQRYLQSYLELSRLSVEWDSTLGFVQKLWQEWEKSSI
jgi:hypothetical protein